MVGDAATAACAHRIKSGMNIRRFVTNSSVLFVADERAVRHTVYHPGAVLSANLVIRATVGMGQKRRFGRWADHFRSSPMNGQFQSPSPCLKGATSRREHLQQTPHQQKKTRHAGRKGAGGLSTRTLRAFQTRQLVSA